MHNHRDVRAPDLNAPLLQANVLMCLRQLVERVASMAAMAEGLSASAAYVRFCVPCLDRMRLGRVAEDPLHNFDSC